MTIRTPFSRSTRRPSRAASTWSWSSRSSLAGRRASTISPARFSPRAVVRSIVVPGIQREFGALRSHCRRVGRQPGGGAGDRRRRAVAGAAPNIVEIVAANAAVLSQPVVNGGERIARRFARLGVEASIPTAARRRRRRQSAVVARRRLQRRHDRRRRLRPFAVARGADGRRDAHAARQHDRARVPVALSEAAAPGDRRGWQRLISSPAGRLESASLPNASSPLHRSTSL